MKAVTGVEMAHEDGVWSVDWAGDTIMTGGLDGGCRYWRVNASNEANPVLEHVLTSEVKSDMGIQSVLLRKDGKGGISCSQDGVIKVFDDYLKDCGTIKAGIMNAWGLALSHDGDAIASGSEKGSINIWATDNMELQV